MSKKLNIGILTSSPKANEKLAETIKSRGHEAIFLQPEKLMLLISQFPAGYDRAYHESEADNPIRLHSSKLDAIIPRVGSHVGWAASCLRFLSENMSVYCYNSPWALVTAQDKSFTLQRLSSAKIRVPKTIACTSPQHVKWIVQALGLPVVLKTNLGSQGRGVAVVDSETSANSVFEFLFHQGLSVILEEFIPTKDFSDIRAWVIGDKVKLAMRRTATKKGEMRANISQGGTGQKVELSEEDQAICVRAAQACGLGVAGVDIIQHSGNGLTYCLEVNANPGQAIINICKYDIWNDVVEYVETECKRESGGTSAEMIMRHDLILSGHLMGKIDHLMQRNAKLEKAIAENLKFMGDQYL